MQHYYIDVPGLGAVALSRHAQAQAEILGVSDEGVKKILWKGNDTPDGMEVVWREKEGIRLVILLHPVPFSGAKLVKTLYKVRSQLDSRRV